MRIGVRIVSLLFVVAAAAPCQDAARSNYTFTAIARTGRSADGVTFGSYFQPGGINNQGKISFAPAVATGGESVFLANGRALAKVSAAGDRLPGGASFGYALGPVAMTAFGDTAFISTGLDVPLPLGLGAGVYRTVFGLGPIPVMIPGVTRTPDGKRFHGAAFNAHINDRQETVFPGIVCSPAPSKVANPRSCDGGILAFGVYRANALGQISAVVEPGSPAPGGSTFDYAQVPFINDASDIAFDGHVFKDDCNSQGQEGFRIFCGESVYLKKAGSSAIVSIAHQGDNSPVFGKKYFAAFGPVLNGLGDLVFIADLSPAGIGENAVFLYSHGTYTTIAKPGDEMPGGRARLTTAGGFPHNAYLNNNLGVAFVGTLDNGDQGLYFWSHGSTKLVAKTGMEIPGVGTIANLNDFGAFPDAASTQVAINDLGRIVFAANLREGGAALLVAAPR